jgi:type VI secretion system ImpM family protein
MGFLSPFRKRSADDPPPTESWPLFAFGKLPVYKDFISAGLTDDVSREFRDWLSNGFSRHWSSRDDCRPAEIPLHAFLLRLPESRKMAVGALWGSTDQGGLRKFPFALFTILPAGKPAASVLTALDYLPVFESRAREIRRKYDAGGSLAAVYQDLRGAKIEIPVRTHEQIRLRLVEALSRSRVGLFATALFGDDAPAQWSALLSGLDTAARSPTAGAAAFRLPLANETAPFHQLQLWTLKLAMASPSAAGPTGVLYRTGGAVPCGVIFFRDTKAEDILLFHPAAIPTDFVEEIPKPLRRAAAEAAIEPAAAEAPATQPSAPTLPAPTLPAPTPPAISVPATEAPPIEPAAGGAAPPPAATPPAEKTPPPEAAPPAGPQLGEEILLLGAAAPAAEVRPAPVPASAGEAAPELPPVSEKPAVPETPAVAEPPAATLPAAPATDVPSPPALLPPAPPPHAEPAGWDLPLASLLGPG